MKKILVIEDNDNIRENLKEFLEIKAYMVEDAKNGYIGIQKILQSKPDLVLCDIMMPEIDGYEVLETIRKAPTLANTPFIFLTAKVKPENIREGMQLGADDYITKPFKMSDVVKAIEARLKRDEIQKMEINKKVEVFKNQLGNVYSHELNTPMNGIIGFADLLYTSFDEFGKAEILEMLGDIKYSAERLNRTIGNIIKFADIQKLISSPININKYPIGKTDSFKEFIEEKAIEKLQRDNRADDLQIDLIDGSLKIGKEDLLKIIMELLDNACKFSSPGESIILKSSVANNKMVFTVEDHGIGSENLSIKKLDAFVQFNKEKYATQGLGLGLFFVKNLCMLNHAQFEIKSKLNKGTLAKVSIAML